MLLGIDKGTTYTKSSEDKIIRSTIRKDNNDILIDNKLAVELSGEKFIVGEQGNYSTDLLKASHDNTRLLVYTMIALSVEKRYIETDLVVGLPIGLYAKQKNNMKQLFTSNLSTHIKINNRDQYIKINRIEVFPEGAGAFYCQQKKDALVIDIGGLSIDTALFQNTKLQKYSTYSMGIMKLYSKIANSLNSLYDLSLTEWDIPDILQNGLFIYGQEMPIDFQGLIKEHVLQIIERLKLEYDIKAIRNVLLTGGGSLLLRNYINTYIPQATLLNSHCQFDNAKGFKAIGEVVFK